ncbi:hypothetical protein EPNKCIFM_00139 [Klebsiella phage KP13-16]|nr:hypothetical protein vBKpMFBKp34_104 [Klebsiella phage vB_KpM_FBKp34]UYL04441.1 hypothetical protein EPNKCIFM_00139 [Klebsiella phage KP13-16]
MKQKLVHNYGINDSVDPVSINRFEDGKWKQIWLCPIYSRWKDILRRCYNLKQKDPYYFVYEGCTVSEEWKYFSNFKAWAISKDFDNLCIDKDILIKGNKLYSKETCVMVPNYINCLLTDSRSARGHLPLGVSLKKKKKPHHRDRFQAYCHVSGKIVYLGYHNSPDLAHKQWQDYKIIAIKESLQKYKESAHFNKVVETALLDRIQDIKEDISLNRETLKL